MTTDPTPTAGVLDISEFELPASSPTDGTLDSAQFEGSETLDLSQFDAVAHPVFDADPKALAEQGFDPRQYALDFRAELTPEQKRKLVQIRKTQALQPMRPLETAAQVGKLAFETAKTLPRVAKTAAETFVTLQPQSVVPAISAAMVGEGESLQRVAKRTAESVSALESNIAGYKDLLVKGAAFIDAISGVPGRMGSIVGVLAPGSTADVVLKQPEDRTDEEWEKFFDTEVAVLEQLNQAVKGEGGLAKAIGLNAAELSKYGVELDPEAIQDLGLVADPLNIVPGVNGFSIVSAPTKKILARAATKAGAEAFVARARPAVANYIAKQGEKMIQRGERTSRTGAGAVGAVVSQLATGTPIPGVVTGALIPPAMKLGGWFTKEVVAPAIAKPGTVEKAVRSTVSPIVGGAARGAAAALNPLDNPTAVLPLAAAAGAATPEEAGQVLGPVVGFGAAGGTVRGGARVVRAGADALRASRFKPMEVPKGVKSDAYGADRVADADHDRAMQQLAAGNPDAADRINFIREGFRDSGLKIYLFDNATFSKAVGAPEGATVSAPGYFDPKNNSVYLNQSALALGHEVGHAVVALMGGQRAREFFNMVGQAFSPEQIVQFGKFYDERLRASGITDPAAFMNGDRDRILSEIGAELLSRVVNSQAASGAPPGLFSKALDTVALFAEKLGIASKPDLSGQAAGSTPLGVGPEMQATTRGAEFVRQTVRPAAGGPVPPAAPPAGSTPPAGGPTPPAGGGTPPPVPPTPGGPTPPYSGPVPPVMGVGTPPPVPPAGGGTPPPVPPTPPPSSNIRVTPEQQAAADARKVVSGAADAEAALRRNARTYGADSVARFNEINAVLQREQGDVAPVSLDYESVTPKLGGGKSAKTRKIEQDAAYTAEALGAMPPDLRTQVEKTTIPVRWIVRDDNVNLLAMSVDKVLANAVKATKKAFSAKAESLLPYAVDSNGVLTPEAWRQFVTDLTAYTKNQANGFAGDGTRVNIPADYRGVVPPENQTYRPVQIPKANADFINLVMALPPPATSRGQKAAVVPNIEAAKLAEASGRPVVRPARTAQSGKEIYVRPSGERVPIAETNPLRDQLAARGVDLTGRELFQVTEELDLQRIKSVASRPESQFRAPSTDLVRAGFMPKPSDLADDRTSGKAFSGFFSDVTKGEKKYVPNKPWEPILDLSREMDFVEEQKKHTGNFDAHISTSIPGYQDVLVKSGKAISKLPAGSVVLDVAGSEGSWAKAVTALSGGNVRTVVLDPNRDMANFYRSKSAVDGSTYVEEAFLKGFENDDGSIVPAFNPAERFDVIHEGMGFQFISPDRDAQIAEVKRLLKDDGVFITEEKLLTPPEVWKANEAKKDRDFKSKYFTEQALAEKQKVVKFQQDPNESKAVGMVDNMVTDRAFEESLRKNFAHVVQHWDSGNFKGYIASDSRAAIDFLLSEMGSTESEFNTTKTPREVTAESGKFMPSTGEDLQTKLAKPGWAIITGTREAMGAWNSPENIASNAALEAELNQRGIPYQKISGYYKGVDQGPNYMIESDEATARELGQKYGQESVLTNRGLVYSADGSVTPVKPGETVVGDAAKQNEFYSELPDGTAFSMGLDFDAPRQFMPRPRRAEPLPDVATEDFSKYNVRPKPAVSKEPVVVRPKAGEAQLVRRPVLPDSAGDVDLRLVHYSGKSGELTTLDPGKMGTSAATPIDLRGQPKTYFFVEGSRSGADEPITGGTPYGVRVHGGGIYDMTSNGDPLGWLANPNREKADQTLRDAGYTGLRVKTQGRDVVALFEPTAATKLGAPGKTAKTVRVPEGAPKFMPMTEAGKALEAKGMKFDPDEPGAGVYRLRVREAGSGRVVGSISAGINEDGSAKVGLVSVDPEFQKQGVGTALYRELGARLQRDGVTEIKGTVINPGPVLRAREKVFGPASSINVRKYASSTGDAIAMDVTSRVDPDRQFMPEVIEREISRNEDFANRPEDAEAIAALDVAKRPKFGAARDLPEGTPVALRIDIPAFNRTGKYVVTVHEPAGPSGGPGKAIGYDTAARVLNPRFVIKPGVERIRSGESAKFPVATVDGEYVRDRSVPQDLGDWVPVGMDPKDHAFFYDKRTDEPVISGDEAFSVGNTVFVKNPKYGNRSDFAFMPMPEGVEGPDDLRPATEFMKTSAVNVLHADSPELPPATRGNKRSLEDVAAMLQEAALDQWGTVVNSGNMTPEQRRAIVENGLAEVRAALASSGKNAFDWYTTAVKRAVDVIGVLHPEVVNDEAAKATGVFPNARAAKLGMMMAMAITSQNIKVRENARYAEEQFTALKTTGKFDTSKTYGSKGKAIKGNLDMANKLIEAQGWEGAEEFIRRDFTVGELNAALEGLIKDDDADKKIAGKVDDVVQGAALFGPKIGQGFLQNLFGNFNPVTIDLWMRRTWGRWTGDVREANPFTPTRVARLIDAAREKGIGLPESLKPVRPVTRRPASKTGKEFRTLSEAYDQRLIEDKTLRTDIEQLTRDLTKEWSKRYRSISQYPVTPAERDALVSGMITLDQLTNRQLRFLDSIDKRYSELKRKPESKAAWRDEIFAKAGKDVYLENDDVSKAKPEWAKAALVIDGALGPIDVPSGRDRAVISSVVNDVRKALLEEGIETTNADIQAILWYPEKDLWKKLSDGGTDSDLKQSYDDEFLAIAEARGLGDQARAAIDRAARTGGAAGAAGAGGVPPAPYATSPSED